MPHYNYKSCKYIVSNFILSSQDRILWLYGKSGVGKTAMIHALMKQLGKGIHPITTEEFFRLFMIHLKQGFDLGKFFQGDNYIILLDDLDGFIKDKLVTQAEFGNIIKRITQSKEIKFVLVSNQSLLKFPNLKLKGLCQEIKLQKPDTRLKIQFLNTWVEQKGLYLSNLSKMTIAKSVRNLFELRGSLNKLAWPK